MKLPENKRTRTALFLILIAIGVAGIVLVMDFLTIGPGYPPPEALQKWFIPQPGYEYGENGSVIENKTIYDDIFLIGEIEEGCPPPFPDLSRYCSSAAYADTRAGDQYLVVNWYFNTTAALPQAEKELCQYLQASGNLSSAELTLPAESEPSQDDPGSRPLSVPATKFESDRSSGYCVVVEKPLTSEHDDYFIVYFGVVGPAALPAHTAVLEGLMLRSYPFHGARPLTPCS
jgi:hypothetical protein